MFKIILENTQKLMWFFVPLFVLTLLCYYGVLPKAFADMFVMTEAALIFLFGIPLSIALRLDQWSFYLGTSTSRETVLLLGLIVPFVNLNVLLLIKKLIFSKAPKDSKQVKTQVKDGKIKK